MARIAGVNIPTKKRVLIALTYIYGIGGTASKQICKEANLPDDKRVADMSDSEVTKVREIIDRDYIVEGDLRRQSSMDIKRSGTRREDKLMGRKDLSRVWLLRKLLDEMTNVEAMEFLLGKLGHTKSNREFLDSMST